jgi:hypothetical protein
MMQSESILKRLLDALLPNRAAPVLGKVIRAYEGPGQTKYAVDIQVVTAGTLEETDLVIGEVPINPIWVGKKGKGIYAIPPVDTLVIVEFLSWNPAYPYIAGIWSDEYEAGEFKTGQMVITDGEGVKLGIDTDALLLFETRSQSLKKILDEILDEVSAIQTKGAPPQHVVSPDSIQKLQAIKQEIAKLLKE